MEASKLIMNIYLHVEIADRELDSKLLLAVVAASRGHHVVISDISGLMWGVNNDVFPAGVFHTKDLCHEKFKINRNQLLKYKGYIITSIDEEGGLIDYGYDEFAKMRYSDETIAISSAVFGWGKEDTDTLKRIYPQHSHKIHLTGSPRADLWSAQFKNYWGRDSSIPARPYLLVSSNMGRANHVLRFHEVINSERKQGLYERDPRIFKDRFYQAAEDYKKTISFIEAIRYLAERSGDYDIVLRPHPVELIDAWDVFLEGLDNVYVIRNGSITAWVNNAFAVMHNGCTTALEAAISGKPVITYMPFEQEYARDLPNDIGVRVHSHKELLEITNGYSVEYCENKSSCGSVKLPSAVANKVHVDNQKLAADKMVDVWSGLSSSVSAEPIDLSKVKKALMIRNVKIKIKKTLSQIFGDSRRLNNANDFKFAELNESLIRSKFFRFKESLNINEEIKCDVVGPRMIIVRPNNAAVCTLLKERI